MKMAKASEQDIDAAGDAMSLLNCISSGYYPSSAGDDCEDSFFDEDNPKHLRKFYDLMYATVDKAPGWPGRVIGGMCYVILFDKNQIVDPDADVLELHPRFGRVKQERDELLAALQVMLRDYTAVHDIGDVEMQPAIYQARAAIAKATGGEA